MDYGKYKNARNASWQCILDYNISQLPVIVTDIIHQSDNIRLFKNSDINLLKPEESGKTIYHNGIFEIVYRDTELSYRCRFTIAHELGHVFLGHLMFKTTKYRTFVIQDETESEANVFARNLLAPACVLHELQVLNPHDIAQLCNISLQSAEYRSQRIEELEKRNKWYTHPLERQVYSQFEDFINNRKS